MHGIAVDLARDAVKNYGIEGAVEIRDYALSRIAASANGAGRPIEDPPAYLAGCLRDGHGARSPEERNAEREKQERVEKARRKKVETVKKETEEKERIRGQRKLQDALILRLSPAEHEKLKQAAIDALPLNRRKKKTHIENQMRRMVTD